MLWILVYRFKIAMNKFTTITVYFSTKQRYFPNRKVDIFQVGIPLPLWLPFFNHISSNQVSYTPARSQVFSTVQRRQDNLQHQRTSYSSNGTRKRTAFERCKALAFHYTQPQNIASEGQDTKMNIEEESDLLSVSHLVFNNCQESKITHSTDLPTPSLTHSSFCQLFT